MRAYRHEFIFYPRNCRVAKDTWHRRPHFADTFLCFSGQYDQFLRDRQKLVERANGIVRYQDLLLAVQLEVNNRSTQ